MSDADVRAMLRWVAAHDPYQRVILVCAHSQVPQPRRGELVVVWNGCLGSAHVGVPAQLLALGAQQVTVVECLEQPNAVRARFDAWRELVGERVCWQMPGKRGWRRGAGTVLQLGAVPLPRRTILGLRSQTSIDVNADALERTRQALEVLGGPEAEEPAGELNGPPLSSHRSDRSTSQGIQSVAGVAGATEDSPAAPIVPSVGQAGADPSADIEAIVLAAVDCSACGVCVEACPKQALDIVVRPYAMPVNPAAAFADPAAIATLETAESNAVALPHPTSRISELVHDLAACRGCRECIALCPRGALSQTGTPSWAEIGRSPKISLAQVHTKLCPQCASRYDAREGNVCALCGYRAAHPFTSVKPEEIAKIRARRLV